MAVLSRALSPAVALAALLGGCAGPDPSGAGMEGAGTIVPPEVLECRANRDGMIERDEMPSVPGIRGRQRVAGPVDISSAGAQDSTGEQRWQMPEGGDVVEIATEDPAEAWYGSSFPGATYSLVLDGAAPLAEQLVGVYEVRDDAVLLLGLASRDAGAAVLLPYDLPPTLLRLPVRLGDAWTAEAQVSEGSAGGVRVVSDDTYEISVDARGTIETEEATIRDAIRVKVLATSRTPATDPLTRLEFIFYRECLAEVARIVAHDGDLGPEVTSAAQVRSLAF